MLKHKHWLKLRALDKRERRILARKIGMKRIGNKFLNYIYSPPTADEIMRNMERNPQNQKLVEDFLDILPKLKRMDQNRLVSLGHKLRIDISPDEKQPVRKILEQGEVGEIGRKLNKNRVFFIRRLVLIALMCVIGYSIHSFPEEVFDVLSSDDLLERVFKILIFMGIWIGSAASIIGFFLVFSPETTWKKRITACWTNNRLDLIVILIFYIVYNHPDRENLFSLMGGLGSILSVFLTLVYHRLGKWREKYFYRVYYGIIVMLFVGAIWINFFIIEGKVVYSDNKKGVKQAIVSIVRKDKEKKWPCKKYKNEDTFMKFCGTETDDQGNFFLRLIPFVTAAEEDFQLEATDREEHKSEPTPFKLRQENISIEIKRKIFEGKWECSTEKDCRNDSFKFKIEEKNSDNINFTNLDGLLPVPFNNDITNFSYHFGEKKFFVTNKKYNGKITIDNGKLKLTVETTLLDLDIYCCR